MMQLTKSVTSFANLLELEDYLKYFVSRTDGVSTVINNLYDQAFADPSYYSMLYVSINFVQLLDEIKQRMPNAIEYNTIENIEVKHLERFWKSRSGELSNGDLGYYFVDMQVQRCHGNTGAHAIAFDPLPLARFPRNICLYRSKLANVGNCLEIGEQDHSYNQMFSFHQHMNFSSIPNDSIPWYLFVNEANIEAYKEVLQVILTKAYLAQATDNRQTTFFIADYFYTLIRVGLVMG